MQLNDTAKRDALNALPRRQPAIREQIPFSSVRLSHDRFIGSGALLTDANQTQMLRQRHPPYATKTRIVETFNSSSATGSRAYLMGATPGANFLPDQLPPDKPIINNAAAALYAGGYLF